MMQRMRGRGFGLRVKCCYQENQLGACCGVQTEIAETNEAASVLLFFILLLMQARLGSSSADNDSVSTGRVRGVLFVIRGAAGAGVVAVAATGTTTVELDAIASSGDAIALTCAGRRAAGAVIRHGRGGAWGGAAGS